MSQLSSPAGSPRLSQHSQDDVQLTPRSKVKALLAGLDDSEDDTAHVVPKKSAQSRHSPASAPKVSKQTAFVEDDSDEEEDVVLVPKGRLAARLQAQTKDDHVTLRRGSEDEIEDILSSNEEEERNRNDTPSKSQSHGTRPLLARDDVVSIAEKAKRAARSSSESDIQENQEFGRQSFQSRHEAIDSGSEHEPSVEVNRFAALVEKKRAERMAKEAIEQDQRKKKAATRKKNAQDVELPEVDSDTDDSESGVRMTQRSRPARRAGKKAMEDIARETQRISRNMQLAHEAKTRKKITKESLLARFKPKQPFVKAALPASSSTMTSSIPNSDGEDHRTTPATSPEGFLQLKTRATPALIPETSNLQGNSDDDLPTLEEVLIKPVDKGKSRAPDLLYQDIHPEVQPFQAIRNSKQPPAFLPEVPKFEKKVSTRRHVRVVLPKDSDTGFDPDSDDDLEVVQSKVFRLFDNLPKRSSAQTSLTRLRALARLSSPSKRAPDKDKSNQNFKELTSDLRIRARQQAAAERAEKIKILRSKGVIIQTAEERQSDQLQVEDILEKARQDVEELTKKERQAAKKEAQANGEQVDESSEDDEYREDELEDDDMELSGSEDEADAGEASDSNKLKAKSLIDVAASEHDIDEEEGAEDEETRYDDDGGAILPDGEPVQEADEEEEERIRPSRRRNIKRVLDDDDEEDYEQALVNIESLPTMAVESPSAIQNPFGQQAPLTNGPMGLTQAFAATMADSQLQEGVTQTDSLVQLRSMPSLDFPNLIPVSQADMQPALIEELDVDLHLTQTQVEHDTLHQNTDSRFTQLSEMPDPTQDIGFEDQSPLRTRFAAVPMSTIDTVVFSHDAGLGEAKKRGRLMKKQARNLASFSDDDDEAEVIAMFSNERSAAEEDDNEGTAFNVMRKAAKKIRREERQFDKNRSNARDMFEEQAQESEDEYAGLGGASDDSDGEEDEEIRQMIDEGEVKVDERKIAAYYA